MSFRHAVHALPRRAAPQERGADAVLWTAAASAFGLLVTLLGAADLIRFEYRNLTAHVVLDTASACIALLVAYLVYGRLLRNGHTQDFLLLQALVLLGAAELGPLILSPLVDNSPDGTLDVWLPLATRVTALLFVSAAALVNPGRRLQTGRARWGFVPAAATFGVLLVVMGASSAQLPVALDPDLAPSAADGAFNAGHPLLIAGLFISVVCFGIAAVAFTRHASRSDDEMLRWLGAACALAMFSRINYMLFPSLYSQWLYSGDLLRIGFYLLLLVGAAREIRQHWTTRVEEAVVEDRRRLARELHDGVLQELTYIRQESGRLREIDPGLTNRINGACDRALDEARQAVEALGSQTDEPLGFAVHRAVRQVADRHDLKVELDIDDSVPADPAQRHALMRVVREAMTNAARHGRADAVIVRLAQEVDGRRTLTVEDNGAGFDVANSSTGAAAGFGLTSMRERADGLPGSLAIQSSPGCGTTVTVTWWP